MKIILYISSFWVFHFCGQNTSFDLFILFIGRSEDWMEKKKNQLQLRISVLKVEKDQNKSINRDKRPCISIVMLSSSSWGYNCFVYKETGKRTTSTWKRCLLYSPIRKCYCDHFHCGFWLRDLSKIFLNREIFFGPLF